MTFRFPVMARLLTGVLLASILTGFSAAPVAALDSRWPHAERYALSLLNCARTGGWVKQNGACIARGTGRYSPYRKPLSVKTLLAADIARLQARRVAKAGYLDHYLGGSIKTRFARAGIHCCAYGESLGHWRSGVKAAVIQVQQMVQAEKGANGWHWRNLKDKRFKFVGIGVWVKGRDVYVAFDFWDGK
jgi:hypothetical protein